jgi:hypothetical protein
MCSGGCGLRRSHWADAQHFRSVARAVGVMREARRRHARAARENP